AFVADGAQYRYVQVARRPFDGNDVQPRLRQPAQDIAVIILIRLVADAFALQRLVGVAAANMHDKCRAVLQSCKAPFERLQSPGLRSFRIAEQDRIIELNNLASGRYQRRDFVMDGVGVVEGKLSSITL